MQVEGVGLSKFPGRRWRKGKGQNRQKGEKNEHSYGNESAFQKNGQDVARAENGSGGRETFLEPPGSMQSVPVGKSHRNKHRKKIHSTSNDGSPDALRGARPNGEAGTATQGAERQSASLDGDRAQLSAATKKRRHRRRAKGGQLDQSKQQGGNQQSLRNIRQAIKPVPEPEYTPVPTSDQQNSPQIVNPVSKQFSGQSSARQDLYAALDLGTNNCRLLVAMPQERGRFRVVDGFSRIVRLGEGLGQSGRLSANAMDRAVEALKICSDKLLSHGIRRHRLIATEACRQAENGSAFLERVRSETGMSLEIIDRQTEAYLAAEGCGALMDKKADAAVLFDIGGGSSELILVNKRIKKKRIADQIVAWTSLPIGVVTLAERHGGQVVTREIFRNMIDEVKSLLAAFEGKDDLSRLWKNGRVHLLGTSGTVTTLAGIHLNLPRYERRLVDGLWLNSQQIDVVVEGLLAMDYKQRANSPCIGTERADLVMAGCAILEAIRQTWPSDRLRVADRGLREGILTQMMERDGAWLPAKSRRRKSWPPRQASREPQGDAEVTGGRKNSVNQQLGQYLSQNLGKQEGKDD